MRILIAQINPTVGDLEGNCQKILHGIRKGQEQKAELVLFPELALSGYPPDDFLLLPQFTQAIDHYLDQIVQASKNIAVIVGTPKLNPKGREKKLCNSAAIIHNQTLIGLQDKSLLPTYDVFDERRYFEPSLKHFVWHLNGRRIGITICEDIWQHSGLIRDTHYDYDPIEDLRKQTPELVINLSASPYRMGKCEERFQVCATAAKTLHCPIVLCNQVGGNDSLIFDGNSLFVDGQGRLIKQARGFEEDWMLVDAFKVLPSMALQADEVGDLYKALILGVTDYFKKLGLKKACLGISGGIDSAVVAVLAAQALGPENVLGLMMPSRFSTPEGIADSRQLIKNLGIAHQEISIEKPFQGYLDLLQPYFEGRPFDATEENLQARIRGALLMAFSNKFGHIVLSTGNKSELAMGYSTLYGDMVGGLGVINDVTKKYVYELARWLNRNEEVIPDTIIRRPPSAELREGQLDSDSLPPYEVLDTVLCAYVEEHLSPELIAEKYDYPLELVQELIRKIHRNEYKRRQSAPGLRVTSRAFSVGRRFPIVQRWVY